MYATSHVDDVRFRGDGHFDLLIAINAVYQMQRTDVLVAEWARLLKEGGMLVVVQYDGYLGEVALALARAAVQRDDLVLMHYEEGQRGASAASVTPEHDAVASSSSSLAAGVAAAA
eukprot:37205-Eustigmatos_ZCMA.PRE.1